MAATTRELWCAGTLPSARCSCNATDTAQHDEMLLMITVADVISTSNGQVVANTVSASSTGQYATSWMTVPFTGQFTPDGCSTGVQVAPNSNSLFTVHKATYMNDMSTQTYR